jgi:hypothetical protein
MNNRSFLLILEAKKAGVGSEYAKRGIDRIIKKIRGWRKRKIEEIKR